MFPQNLDAVTRHNEEPGPMTEYGNAFNRQVAEEFRANGGAVGGTFEGTPLVLLHHTGAKSGTEYVSPLGVLASGDGSWIVVASAGGSVEHPSWYFNLRKHPDTTIEVPDGAGGVTTRRVRARIPEGTEHETLFAAFTTAYPHVLDFQAKSDRRFPLVVLEPLPAML
jgi:deazaflavin-dependent oxidoreductase (nitroreductase family)